MSIKSEITRISANVSDSYTAVNEIGVSTEYAETSDNLAATIRAVREELDTILDEINGTFIEVVG